MLTITGVQRSYEPLTGILRVMSRGASTSTVRVLDSIDLEVRPGSILGLVGPNGAGKTTLIRIIAGLLTPDAGEVRIAGVDPVNDRHQAARVLGLVLTDDRSLYWRLSGRQNLEFHGALYGLSRRDAGARADELLEMVGLADRDRHVFGYSTGMRASLAIARALVHDPEVLVLDEPTRSLDPVASRDTCELLQSLAREGRTIMLSSHHLEELERTADDVAILLDGRIQHAGTVDSLRSEGSSAASKLEELLRADRIEDHQA